MFMLGLTIGVLAGLALLVCHNLLYAGLLERKAAPTDRTPECINGKFFYIVPESEYVEMRFNSLAWIREHEQTYTRPGA
jgi:hypothetical protein